MWVVLAEPESRCHRCHAALERGFRDFCYECSVKINKEYEKTYESKRVE